MAITDYASLKTTVADYLHRSDLSDAVISNFVQFGELRLNRKLRLLEQEEEASLSLTAGTNEVTLPAGYLEVIDLYYTTDKYKLQPQTLKTINSARNYDTVTSKPCLYAISGGKLRFESIADDTYALTFDYFKGFDIETDDTNWLLTNAPDAYLYASLLEAKAYVKSQADVALWSQGLSMSIDDLNRLDSRTRKNARIRHDPALVGNGRFDINRGY